MKFVEAIGAPLFNGNEWANTSLMHSEPFKHCKIEIWNYNNHLSSDYVYRIGLYASLVYE